MCIGVGSGIGIRVCTCIGIARGGMCVGTCMGSIVYRYRYKYM